MNRKVKFPRNTPEEEAAIARGIATDPDTREVTDEEFARMRPFAEFVKNRGGRPKLENPKEPVSIRLDADILAQFRAGGDGWQTRMNDALREWLKRTRSGKNRGAHA